ncbi:hypothetical protein Trydic_g1379 [Trypoxylus dichotomus]
MKADQLAQPDSSANKGPRSKTGQEVSGWMQGYFHSGPTEERQNVRWSNSGLANRIPYAREAYGQLRLDEVDSTRWKR